MPTKKKELKSNPVIRQGYIALGVLYITAYFLDYTLINYFIKPLPVLLLIFCVRRETDTELYVYFALISSIIGDIALMFEGHFFIVGLAAFLVAHIFYAKAFSIVTKKRSLHTSIPFIAYVIAFLFFISPHTAEYRLPIIFYSLVISIMLWRSFLAAEKKNYKSVFWGAMLFALSDSLIAINKFYQEFTHAQVIIMITYWTGQYLIYRPFEKEKIKY